MKKYLKEIKSKFPYIGKKEKLYLENFENSLINSELTQLTYDELVEHFGEPTEIATQYFMDIDLSIYRQKILLRKKLTILFTITALVTIFFVIKSYIEAKTNYIDREIIEIQDQGDINE